VQPASSSGVPQIIMADERYGLYDEMTYSSTLEIGFICSPRCSWKLVLYDEMVLELMDEELV